MGMSMISMVKRMMMIGMVFKAARSLYRDVAADEVDHHPLDLDPELLGLPQRCRPMAEGHPGMLEAPLEVPEPR